MTKKIKRRLTILSILVLIISIGTSYAYYSFQAQNTNTIAGNIIGINATLTVQRIVGDNSQMVPLQDAALYNALNGTGGQSACVDSNGNLSCQVYRITLQNNASRIGNIKGTITLQAASGSNNVYQNLTWQEITNATTLKTGTTPNKMTGTLVSNYTLEQGATAVWYIAVWIHETGNDQNNTDKGNFTGTVTFNVSNSVNLKQYIQDTYNNATDKVQITYGNTGTVTQSASTGLLQDEAGNIRYFGANPNNYLGPVTSSTKYADIETSTGTNFGTFDTLAECTEAIQDYLDTDTCQEVTVYDGWRIIGIVDNKVKVIRTSSIGNYVYDDTSNDGQNSNDYSISVLNTTLNGSDGSSGYYGNLSDKTMFDKTTWSLRGTDWNTFEQGVYANEIYNIERTTGSAYGSNATSTQAYLAPMYPSDYMYGVNFNLCKKPGYYYDSNNDTQDDYSNSECTSNNWLYSGVWEWLLSPYSGTSDHAFGVDGTGSVNYGRINYASGVRPSGYLKSDIEIDISEGNGSVSTPYLMG